LKSDDEQELVKNIQTKLNSSEKISADSIVQKLQARGFELKDSLISYFSEKEQMFVFLGRHPLKDGWYIPISELERWYDIQDDRVKIMMKYKSQTKPIMEEQRSFQTVESKSNHNSINFAAPEIRFQASSIPHSQHQNLSKSLSPQLASQEINGYTSNSQQAAVNYPNLLSVEPQFNLSINSNLSAQPTFVDLDVLRANQQKKTKTKER